MSERKPLGEPVSSSMNPFMQPTASLKADFQPEKMCEGRASRDAKPPNQGLQVTTFFASRTSKKREPPDKGDPVSTNPPSERRALEASKTQMLRNGASQELSLIKEMLSQKASEHTLTDADADLLLARKLQAEELQRGRTVIPVAKKRTPSTLDHFFKRPKP